ncbi:hypothetical protein POM88_000566 [Heracleum sosnowskyi]|uniref:Uncharacterized protein n=1 Tax=Heracleum sosnowskyi TaxID=360622 RepID=A0AAD8JE67_9APIA|nr:hypothetical protein POM88_000566 [Heracleum sosnowskyi]
MPHHFSSLDLTHLRLLRVEFYKPTFRSFTYLIKLELIDATLYCVESIYDCPLLEKLTLIICENLFPNNFCAPKLKCLHQAKWYHVEEDLEKYWIEDSEDFTMDHLEIVTFSHFKEISHLKHSVEIDEFDHELWHNVDIS